MKCKLAAKKSQTRELKATRVHAHTKAGLINAARKAGARDPRCHSLSISHRRQQGNNEAESAVGSWLKIQRLRAASGKPLRQSQQ